MQAEAHNKQIINAAVSQAVDLQIPDEAVWSAVHPIWEDTLRQEVRGRSQPAERSGMRAACSGASSHGRRLAAVTEPGVRAV